MAHAARRSAICPASRTIHTFLLSPVAPARPTSIGTTPLQKPERLTRLAATTPRHAPKAPHAQPPCRRRVVTRRGDISLITAHLLISMPEMISPPTKPRPHTSWRFLFRRKYQSIASCSVHDVEPEILYTPSTTLSAIITAISISLLLPRAAHRHGPAPSFYHLCAPVHASLI